MKRRALLALCASVPLGGCLALDDPPRKRIAWIRLVNERTEPFDITVLVERDGEEVSAESYRLGTGDGATVRSDAPVDGPGRYTVRFRADDQWIHVDPSEYAGVAAPCIGVCFELHEQGTLGYEVTPGQDC